MKKILIFITALTAYILPAYSQSENTGVKAEKDTGLMCVEKPADFPGGNEALCKWVYSNLKYPKQARKNHQEGDVTVKFTIEKDGTVNDVELLKGVNPLLDEEALRIVKMMPAWSPGTQNGVKIRGQYVIDIPFRLSKKDRRNWIKVENYYKYNS